MLNAIYFLSDVFDYRNTISPAYGEPFALDYNWVTAGLGQIGELQPDISIIDNRIDAREFPLVQKYASNLTGSRKIVFKLHDPYIEHSGSYDYYKFILSLGDSANINFITVYQPCEYIGYMYSKYRRARFIFTPYLYDEKKEVNLSHAGRVKKVLISGADDKLIYPLRSAAKRARLVNPLFRAVSDELRHPGYPDIGQPQSHSLIGEHYISFLSRYTNAFCCSSRDRLEFLKYREIAYAGCAPLGDLPATLLDCPKGAFTNWRRNHIKLAVDLIRQHESESVAGAFRKFMRDNRNPAYWRHRVQDALADL